jgi:hypothetical protein
VTATPATVKRPHRLTLDEARQPITGVTCAKCGRVDAVIYPVDGRAQGALICPSCSPGWLVSWLAWAIDHRVPA